jgi:hypothetical protein
LNLALVVSDINKAGNHLINAGKKPYMRGN